MMLLFSHGSQLCSLVSLQRYTKALSTLQRASLVEKSRQKPQEKIQAITNVKLYYPLDSTYLVEVAKWIGWVLETYFLL